MVKAFFKVALFACHCLLAVSAFAQGGYVPAVLWQKQFQANSIAGSPAAVGTSVLESANGQLLVNYSASGQSAFILRLSADGEKLNESLREGSLSNLFSNQYGYRQHVSLNTDTSLLFAGFGIPATDPLDAPNASVLKKITYSSLDGNQESYVQIPNTDAAVSVCSLPDGGYVVLYKTYSQPGFPLADNWDLAIARYDRNDQQLFNKPVIGSGNEYGGRILYGADGFLYFTGYTDQSTGDPSGTFTGNTGPLPGTFLIQADLDGNFTWVSTTPENQAVDLALTPNNFKYTLTQENKKVNLQKWDAQGQNIWQKPLLNTNNKPVDTDSLLLGITALSDNNILFYYRLNPSGSNDSTYTVLEKLNGNDATLIWQKTIATPNWSATYEVIESANQELLGVGAIKSNPGAVTADPLTYSDIQAWVYRLANHIQATVDCTGAIDTAITLSGSPVLCNGQTLVIKAADNLSYKWYKNDTLITVQTTSQLTVSQAGAYRVVLKNGDGCTDSSRVIDVSVAPAIDTTLTLSGPTAFCAGQTLTFEAAPNLVYQWYMDGAPIANETNAQFTAAASGIYKVLLSNPGGCVDSSRAVTVEVSPAIDTTVTLSGAATLCSGQSLKLTAAPDLTYQWYKDGAAINAATKRDYTVVESGSYQVVLQNTGGCTDSSRIVVVSVAPAIDTTLSVSGSPTACEGQTVTLKAADNLIYQWYKDGAAITNETGAQFIATASGNYKVILQNSGGCIDSSRTVEVSIAGAIDTTLTLSGSTILCAGQTLTMKAAAGLTYAWYNNGSPIAGANGQQYTATATGSYQVILTNATGCSDSSRIVTVQVAASIDTSLTVTGATVLCNAGTVQLTASPNLNYQWYKDGSPLAGATGQGYSVTAPGMYRVLLSNSGGCTDSSRAVTVSNSNIDTTVALSGSPTACAGATITLTAANNLTYQWYKDGAAITNATAKSYNATVSGNYQVVLKNGQGCSDTSRLIAITISDNVTGTISPATATICGNSPVDLTATGGSTYQWFKDGQIINNATAAVYKANAPGIYSVKIFNAGGCNGAAQNTAEVISAAIDTSITVTGSTTVCTGKTVLLTAGVANTYQWLLDGQLVANATSRQLNADKAGNYQVIVSNGQGCTDTSRKVQITITAGPVAAIQPPSTTSICEGSNVVLTATGGPAYAWLKDNVAIANATSASFTATQAGSYTVVVSNGTGCSDTSAAVVLTAYAKPVAAFTAGTYCVGQEIQFVNSSTVPATGTITWKWTFGDNTSSSEKDPKHTYTVAGDYDVTLVVTSSNCQLSGDTLTQKVTIGNNGSGIRYPTLNTVPGRMETISARDLGTTYTWSPATGLSAPTSRVTNVTLNASQEYTVKIDQASGCSLTDTIQVNVQTAIGQTQVFVPTGFTPNNNGRNDLLRPMLINFKSIRYFRVFNRWGKLIFQTSAMGAGWDGRINGVMQPSETYSWMFEGEDNSGKIIRTSGKTVLIR